MTSVRSAFRAFAAALLLAVLAAPGMAQPVRTERLALADPGAAPLLVEGTLRGQDIVDYVVTAEAGQTLSVDLMTSNASAYFNIAKVEADAAIFIGSTSGTVADVRAPETGDYVIRLYLVRSAARRGERADYSLAVGLGGPDFADGLAGGPDYWRVTGVDGALNLRAGPSTRYRAIGRLANGEVLQNRGCRMTGPERWCDVRAAGSGATGWTAGRFLRETAAPPAPAMPPGGPVGAGTPFDATGHVACALGAAPLGQCPFGVIREGRGNAGIWIALGGGVERHLLFEAGRPVAANGPGALGHEFAGDTHIVRVGPERYEIPDAVVNGGEKKYSDGPS